MNKTKNFEIFCRIVGIYFKTSPLTSISILVFNIISGIIPGVITFIWKRFYESISDGAMESVVFLLCVAVLIFTACSKLIDTASTVITRVMLERLKINLTYEVHKKVFDISIEAYENYELYNSLSRAYSIIHNNYVSWLIERIVMVFRLSVSLITMVSVLLTFHVLLLPICIFSILPPVIARIARGKKYYYMQIRQTGDQRKVEYYYSLFTDRFTNRELRVYNSFSLIYDKWRKTRDKLHEEDNEFYTKEGIKQLLVDSSRILGLAGGMAFCIFLSIAEKISIGELGAALTAVQNVQDVFTTILITLGSINNRFLELNELIEMIDKKSDTKKDGEKRIDEPKHIKVNHVSYRYPGSEYEVLKDISMSINQKESIAIVGYNGAGKTTLIKLLLKLYQPVSGEILYNDINVNEIADAAYLQQYSVVFQDFLRYCLNFKENIALTNVPDCEKIHKILHMIDDQTLCETPLETMLGVEYGGIDFSGGQWQKTAFARALYKDSKIMILDEPTANLDPIAEVELFKDILKLKKEKTFVFITHRIGSARLADKIVFINNGQLVEYGTHDSLIKKDGYYAKMFHAQAQWYV